jgi:hypothetical protein
MQELQVMNVQMRIITEDNIDQLMNMSFSNNMNKLLHDDSVDIMSIANKIKDESENIFDKNAEIQKTKLPEPPQELAEESPDKISISPTIEFDEDADFNPFSPKKDEEQEQDQEQYQEQDQEQYQSQEKPETPPHIKGFVIKNKEIKSEFDALGPQEQMSLMKMLAEMKYKKAEEDYKKGKEVVAPASIQAPAKPVADPKSILKIEEEKKPEDEIKDSESQPGSGSGSGSSETKSVTFNVGDENKKIIL